MDTLVPAKKGKKESTESNMDMVAGF